MTEHMKKPSWQTMSAMAGIAVTVVGAITWGARLQSGVERAQLDIEHIRGALEKHGVTDAHPAAERRLVLIEQRQQNTDSHNAALRTDVIKVRDQLYHINRNLDAVCIASRAPGCRLTEPIK